MVNNESPTSRVLARSQLSEATHVIYPEGSHREGGEASQREAGYSEGSQREAGNWTKTCFHVVESWLEDSVKLQQRQEEKIYRVK